MKVFKNIGIIKNQPEFEEEKLDKFIKEIELLRAKGKWTKKDLVKLFFELLPDFDHKETGTYLDQKM